MKLTEEQRASGKKALKRRLEVALGQTARGITDEEMADVIREVCSEQIIPV